MARLAIFSSCKRKENQQIPSDKIEQRKRPISKTTSPQQMQEKTSFETQDYENNEF